jgi:hypothetical protein
MEELVYFIKIHIMHNPITILLSKDLEAQRGKLQYIQFRLAALQDIAKCYRIKLSMKPMIFRWKSTVIVSHIIILQEIFPFLRA